MFCVFQLVRFYGVLFPVFLVGVLFLALHGCFLAFATGNKNVMNEKKRGGGRENLFLLYIIIMHPNIFASVDEAKTIFLLFY